MNNIIQWYLDKQLKWRKQKALHETNCDICFIINQRRDQLNLEDEWREKLVEEKRKEKPDDKVIDDLGYKIALCVQTKRELEKLQVVADELPKYIALL